MPGDAGRGHRLLVARRTVSGGRRGRRPLSRSAWLSRTRFRVWASTRPGSPTSGACRPNPAATRMCRSHCSGPGARICSPSRISRSGDWDCRWASWPGPASSCMAWRILKGELRHAVLWGWTGLYFGWQSLVFNPTMRYQLPVYPLLCLMAAWFIRLSVGPGQAAARQAPGRLVSCGLPCCWTRRSGADRGLGLCLHAHLHAARDAGGGHPLDLSERPRTDQSAHPDLGWLVYQQPLPFPTGRVIRRDALRADLHGECQRERCKASTSRTSPALATCKYSDASALHQDLSRTARLPSRHLARPH